MKPGLAANIKRVVLGVVRRIPIIQAIKNKFLGTLIRVKTEQKVAAITFDDGPDPNWTPKILDVLNEFNAKATFFVIGRRASKYPEIIKKTYELGHSIANHTWDHPCLSIIPRKERMEQIENCKLTISEFDSHLFRPPYGCQSISSRIDTYFCGYEVVAWDVHATDWAERKAEVMAHDLNTKIHPGAIILLHDSMNGKSRHQMLEALIIFLKNNLDYQFVTVPNLLNYGEKKEIIWKKSPNEGDLKSHHERFETIDI